MKFHSIAKKSHLVIVVLALSLQAMAAQKTLVNKDADGFALDRHDAVAFFTQGKAIKGDPKIQTIYQGARYIFVSAENKKLFDAEPTKYIPQYGGYCAYGAASGHAAPVKIETWQIANGKLLLNYDLDVKKEFDKDQADYIRKADANWPSIVEKEGK